MDVDFLVRVASILRNFYLGGISLKIVRREASVVCPGYNYYSYKTDLCNSPSAFLLFLPTFSMDACGFNTVSATIALSCLGLT